MVAMNDRKRALENAVETAYVQGATEFNGPVAVHEDDGDGVYVTRVKRRRLQVDEVYEYQASTHWGPCVVQVHIVRNGRFPGVTVDGASGGVCHDASATQVAKAMKIIWTDVERLARAFEAEGAAATTEDTPAA